MFFTSTSFVTAWENEFTKNVEMVSKGNFKNFWF